MIDWWASKTGVIIFVVVLTGILSALVIMERESFKQEELVRNANNIALLIDAVGAKDGSKLEYEVKGGGEYTLDISGFNLKLSNDKGSVERHFLARANPKSSMKLPGGSVLTIEKIGGSVDVR